MNGYGVPFASRASSGSNGSTRKTTGASAKSARFTPLSAPGSMGLDSARSTANESLKKRTGLIARDVRRRQRYVSPARSVRRGMNNARLVSVRACASRRASLGKSEAARTGPSTSCHEYVNASPTSSCRRAEHACEGRCASASTVTSSARRTTRAFPIPDTPVIRALGKGYMVLFTETVATAELPTKSVTLAVNVYTTPGSSSAELRRTTGYEAPGFPGFAAAAAAAASSRALVTAYPSVASAETEKAYVSGRPPPPTDADASNVTPSHGPSVSAALSAAKGRTGRFGSVIDTDPLT